MLLPTVTFRGVNQISELSAGDAQGGNCIPEIKITYSLYVQDDIVRTFMPFSGTYSGNGTEVRNLDSASQGLPLA